MKKLLLLLLFAFSLTLFSAKSQEIVKNNYSEIFNAAYAKYPEIPRGILEAVAFTNTRIQHIQHASAESESCTGIPNAYGVMGLTLDGENYFKNNLIFVSNLSNYSVDEIIDSPEKNILAYAAAYVSIKSKLRIASNKLEDQLPILAQLSELPDDNTVQNFALNSQLYSYYDFLNSSKNQSTYNFTNYKVDFISLFGVDNYSVLSAPSLRINGDSISNTRGATYQNNTIQTTNYAPALWSAAATCNYSSRNGTAITAVAIHTAEGTYAGTIAWFKDCRANASAHYVVRSSDGQVTQMVLESNKAWHLRTESGYTIGIEHEGYINNAAWYTNAMYISSANLVRDITNSGYGINPLRTYFGPGCTGSTGQCGQGGCTKIKGHQMFPNQTHTDPGPNWNWALYYNLINNTPTINTVSTATGNFYDTGSNTANYANDERKLTLIQPANATSVTINFSSFNIENNYDYLFIYNGTTTSAPLIGKYTGTNSPGIITSTGGALLLEFRSDCATTAPGWAASWTSTFPVPVVSNVIAAGSNPSQTGTYMTFKATATNFISGSTFQWKVNGANPTGNFTVNTVGNQSTFTINTLTNGQIVKCELTQLGAIVSSNTITVSRNTVYCATGASTLSSSLYISKVDLGSISNSSGSSLYSNYHTQSTNILRGAVNSMNVTLVNSQSQNIKVLIWVDWNNNNVFTDSGEKIYESGPGVAVFSSLLANVTPPANTSLGIKRMRIRLVNSGSNLSSCGTGTSWSQGEVEDYSINVALTRSSEDLVSNDKNVADDVIENAEVRSSQSDDGLDAAFVKETVSVFPNPNSGIFTVIFNNSENELALKLYTIDGKKVKDVIVTNVTTMDIDITDQPAGIYFLEVNQGGIISRAKVVKSN